MCAVMELAQQQQESAMSSGDQGDSTSPELVLIVHRLNTCFLAASSFLHAKEMSERAVLGQVDAPSQSATLAGCSLISTLCSMVGSGEPHAILALHCLGFLTMSQTVSKLVCSAGLVPLLLGQLRIASSMEPPLVEAALSLLVMLMQVDVQDAMHPLLNRHASSLVKVAAFFLQPDHQKQCAVLAAQLVEDLSSTYKGAIAICAHAGLHCVVKDALAQKRFSDSMCRKLATSIKLAKLLSAAAAQSTGPQG